MIIRCMVLAFLLFAGIAGAGEPSSPEGSGDPLELRIKDLIEQLGSGDWQARDSATRELTRIGGPALSALERLSEHPDLEVRIRVKRIIWDIKMCLGAGYFACRFQGYSRILRFGGKAEGEDAVAKALDWLHRHQNAEGLWSCDRFDMNCSGKKCTGAGATADFDIGVSGLALLAFLGAGNTHTRGPHKGNVKAAVMALRDVQQENGRFGRWPDEPRVAYNHAICTLALAEAYAMSEKSSLLRHMTEQAVEYLLSRQIEGGGWGYGREKEGEKRRDEPALTAWVVAALEAARIGELHVPENRFHEALALLEKLTDGDTHRTGYAEKGGEGWRYPGTEGRFPPCDTPTAKAVLCRILVRGKEAAGDGAVVGGTKRILGSPPSWNTDKGSIDLYYWFWGSQVAYQVGGEAWKAWLGPMEGALIPNQKMKGCGAGSWDPVGAWGGAGGRVYSTAMGALILEIYYRYPRFLE